MLKIYNDGGRITAAITGDIDHHAARELRSALDEIIFSSRPDTLILDLEGVGFMDSSGVGLVLGRMKAVKAYGGRLILKNVGSDTAEVLRLSGLSRLIAENRTAAKN